MLSPRVVPGIDETAGLHSQPPLVSEAGSWLIRGEHQTSVVGAQWQMGGGGLLLVAALICLLSSQGILALGLLVFGVGVLFTGYQSYQTTLKRRRFGPPTLRLSHQNYAPGDTVELDFSRPIHNGSGLGSGTLELAVKCLDIVGWEEEYRENGETRTRTEYRTDIRWEQRQQVAQNPRSGKLAAHFAFTLPRNLPLNEQREMHWIVWVLSVKQRMGQEFNETSRFLLPVDGEVSSPEMITGTLGEVLTGRGQRTGGRHG